MAQIHFIETKKFIKCCDYESVDRGSLYFRSSSEEKKTVPELNVIVYDTNF